MEDRFLREQQDRALDTNVARSYMRGPKKGTSKTCFSLAKTLALVSENLSFLHGLVLAPRVEAM